MDARAGVSGKIGLGQAGLAHRIACVALSALALATTRSASGVSTPEELTDVAILLSVTLKGAPL